MREQAGLSQTGWHGSGAGPGFEARIGECPSVRSEAAPAPRPGTCKADYTLRIAPGYGRTRPFSHSFDYRLQRSLRPVLCCG